MAIGKTNALPPGAGAGKPEEIKTVWPQLLNGDQIVTPTAGNTMSAVTILKPATLKDYNIRSGVEIAGVTGILDPDGGSSGGSEAVAIAGEEEISAQAVSNLIQGDTVYIQRVAGTINNLPNMGQIDPPAGTVRGVAMAKNRRILVTTNANNPAMTIYDISTSPWINKTLPAVVPTADGRCVAINPQETICAIGHGDTGYIHLYDITTNPWSLLTLLQTIPTKEVNALAFSPDGTKLAVIQNSAVGLIYSTITGLVLSEIPGGSYNTNWNAQGAIFRNNNELIIFNNNQRIIRFNILTSPATIIETLSFTYNSHLKTIIFDEAGTRAVANGSGGYNKYSWQIYDTTQSMWAKIKEYTGSGAYEFGLNLDGNILTTAVQNLNDSRIRQYDLTDIDNPQYIDYIFNNNQVLIGGVVQDGNVSIIGHNAGLFIDAIIATDMTPTAIKSMNTVTSVNCEYGYAKEDIADGAIGKVGVLFKP